MKGTGLRLALSAGLLAIVLPAAARADASGDKQTVEAKIRYPRIVRPARPGFSGAYAVPRLAGQNLAYLESRIDVITEHRRDNPTVETFMAPALGSVSPEIRKAVMSHFTTLNPPPAGPGPQDLAAAGRRIYEDGVAQATSPHAPAVRAPMPKGRMPFRVWRAKFIPTP